MTRSCAGAPVPVPVLVLVLVLVATVACTRSSAPSSSARVEILAAPADGPVAPFVADELAHASMPVLVYVGATWCEPCREFHEAAAAGTLDAQLGPLRILEFDLDRDGDRLAAAGYKSDLVPLFARPAPDGTASGSQTDGVRSGGGYVDQLTPRIRALVSR